MKHSFIDIQRRTTKNIILTEVMNGHEVRDSITKVLPGLLPSISHHLFALKRGDSALMRVHFRQSP